MIQKFLLRTQLVLFFIIISTLISRAQPALPDVQSLTQKGMNIISWMCQYDGIKSIAVQRSNDSVYNYTTIGYVKNTKKGLQGFIDGHPNPGDNWYRLYIAFSSDLTWYSNRVKLVVDSAQLMQQMVLPVNDSLQKLVNQLNGSSTGTGNEISTFTYIRSQYVFTNPFTGHVNVELPDNSDNTTNFSLLFFDQKDKQVLEVPKVPEKSIVIEKRNFQNKGFYKFELKKGAKILEKGYITIY